MGWKKGEKNPKHSEKMKGKGNPNWGKFREKAPNWKGGKLRTPEGYIYIYEPEHPYCNKEKYVMEHRLVMEEHLGRYLKSYEIIHHRNGIKDDNRIKNLEIIIQAPGILQAGIVECPFCSKQFRIR